MEQLEQQVPQEESQPTQAEPAEPLEAAMAALGEEPAEEAQPEEAQPEEASEGEAEETQPQDQEEEDLEPPEGIGERARERFQRLASEVKELRAQLEQERERAEQVIGVLRDTGATPDELAQTFEFIRLAKQGDPASLRQAAEIAKAWLKQVSVALGEDIEVSPLAGHPDLQEKVEAGELSEQDAIEIARAREMQRMASERMQATTAQQQAEMQRQQEVAQAIQQVEQMEAEWAANDPDWEIKRDALMERIEEIARTMPPAAWPHAVRLAYDAVNRALEHARPHTPTPITGAGGRPHAAQQEPKSMLDAAMKALEGE